MTLWTLLKNDHVDITAIGHTILRATDKGALRSRERLVAEMADEIEAHFEAEEDGLFDALKRKEQVRELVRRLEAEHEEIEEELARLARIGRKNTIEWASRFEDFTYLLDRHFHREEHELFPQAQTILTGDELRDATREYMDEKAEEIRARHRRFGIGSTAVWAGAAFVAAAGLVLAAERKGYFRRVVARRPELGDNPQETVKDRSRANRKQRESDPLAPLGGLT
jgi:iron-sulfur cluster repair protein YtfE (RIC family)